MQNAGGLTASEAMVVNVTDISEKFLIHAVLRSVSLNKLLFGTLFAVACISSHADDLIIADDFKSGDLVSADTFNQIFDTIEKVNRTIVDSDLVGVWSCNASEHSANTH